MQSVLEESSGLQNLWVSIVLKASKSACAKGEPRCLSKGQIKSFYLFCREEKTKQKQNKSARFLGESTECKSAYGFSDLSSTVLGTTGCLIVKNAK